MLDQYKFDLLLVKLILLNGIYTFQNVECTHKLLAGFLGGEHNPLNFGAQLIPGFEIFDDIFNTFQKVFGDFNEGINVFLDGFIRGIPNLLQDLFGSGKLNKFMGPLSVIPDDADLPSLLGKKFRSRADIFGILVQLSKKFCNLGNCASRIDGEDSQSNSTISYTGSDFGKFLGELFSTIDHQSLDGFHSGLEELITSLGKGRHNEIFETLSKLPEDFDASSLLGKGSSKKVDGILSRKDVLPILAQFAKSKCSSGCDKS